MRRHKIECILKQRETIRTAPLVDADGCYLANSRLKAIRDAVLAMEGPPPLEEVDSRCLADIEGFPTQVAPHSGLTSLTRPEGTKGFAPCACGVEICWLAADDSASVRSSVLRR